MSFREMGRRTRREREPNAFIRFARLQTDGYKPFAKLPITREGRPDFETRVKRTENQFECAGAYYSDFIVPR